MLQQLDFNVLVLCHSSKLDVKSRAGAGGQGAVTLESWLGHAITVIITGTVLEAVGAVRS